MPYEAARSTSPFQYAVWNSMLRVRSVGSVAVPLERPQAPRTELEDSQDQNPCSKAGRIRAWDLHKRTPSPKRRRPISVTCMQPLLSGPTAGIASPQWHQDALHEAERLHAEGRATFSDWSEAKDRIRAAVSVR